MKDKNIIIPATPRFNPRNQCYGKKQYKLKRRAITDARSLSLEFGETYTIYECPHCGKFHVGHVREV